jgi:hypothetical protein
MVNVKADVVDDSVQISFDPIDGAVDYRVYVLPDDDAIHVESNGVVSIDDALYRCGGNRMARVANLDGAESLPGGAITTLVDNQEVAGFTRSLDDATLGYVYATPAEGRVPVYALGDPAGDADNDCFFMRWHESRVKKYTTSQAVREAALDARFRDDGIVFYVPEDDAPNTRQVFSASRFDSIANNRDAELYFADGPEADVREEKTPVFKVLTAEDEGSIPLMRVFYENTCGIDHDELVAGKSRFDRARLQGASLPVFDLHWSGITGPTTLVVEALESGCPRPENDAILGPVSRPSFTNEFGGVLPPWVTIDELREQSETGEVFINGQFDPGNRPRAVARTFMKVSPGPKPDLDWFMGFDSGDALGELADAEWCGEPAPGSCWQQFRQISDVGDFVFMFVETERWAMQPWLGELWINYGDLGSDVNGKFRFTPSVRAEMRDDSYLYATMEVNAFTTSRRYPQLIISDGDVPVQYTMQDGHALVLQTFGDWPYQLDLEVCDHQYWDVNNQCPRADMRRYFSADDPNDIESLAPNPEVGDRTGVDRSTRFEIYASKSRAYVFLDGMPYGCVDLPADKVPQGAATVTFGDVLYHSGVDLLDPFPYMKENFQGDTSRHFDNLGFKSGVAAPAWNEGRLPCTSLFK